MAQSSCEIHLAVHDHIRKGVQFCSIGSAYMRFGHVHVANLGKALGPQQFLKDLRRNAGDRVLCEADRGEFWRWLLGKRSGPTTEPGKPAHTANPRYTKLTQETTPALFDWHCGLR